LPGNTDAEEAAELYQGMAELAAEFGVAIVGGDTSAAPVAIINVTLIGQAGKHLLTRRAARAGDLIAVTGYFGAAAGGFRLLMEHKKPVPSDLALREAFLTPRPRLAAGEALVVAGVRCAIDVSDGLVADLTHICRQSCAGALVEMPKVPLHPSLPAVFGPEALEMALAGGEDYELIFTAPADIVKKVELKAPCPITVIGTVTGEHPGEVRLIGWDGKPLKLEYQGWQHFVPGRP
jgi:thiamine-monophosphate kinase